MNWKKNVQAVWQETDKVTKAFLAYVVIDSLVLSSKRIGFISLLVLVVYLMSGRNKRDAHKTTFAFSIFLIVLAVLLYLDGSLKVLYGPINKLSEWSYLLILTGIIQLAKFNNRKK